MFLSFYKDDEYRNVVRYNQIMLSSQRIIAFRIQALIKSLDTVWAKNEWDNETQSIFQ